MILRISCLLLVVAGLLYGATRSAQEHKQTLREIIAEHGLTAEATSPKNLDKPITSAAELDDSSQFAISYYIEDGSNQLKAPLFIERYDRVRAKWQSASLGAPHATWQDTDVPCLGSVLSVKPAGSRLLVETHINPSAGCLLILSADLKLEESLYGWHLANIGDDALLYHRSQIHFASVHPAEIALYDFRKKHDVALFPRKPDQAIRRARIAQLQTFYKSHETWCNKWNDPCNAELFDSSLVGEPATNETEHAVAFIISYEQQQLYPDDDQKPSGPKDVLYIYRHTDDAEKLEFREMLLSDAKSKFGDVPLQKLLEHDTLTRVFLDTPSSPASH
jgi:hypothetical protein